RSVAPGRPHGTLRPVATRSPSAPLRSGPTLRAESCGEIIHTSTGQGRPKFVGTETGQWNHVRHTDRHGAGGETCPETIRRVLKDDRVGDVDAEHSRRLEVWLGKGLGTKHFVAGHDHIERVE